MRRKDRERDKAFAYDVIDHCEYGVAALAGGEEGPYCVPLSLVRVGDELFFHCALRGHKLDLLRSDPRVCVTFVTGTQPTYIAEENNYTTFFRSAIVTGTAREVTDPAGKEAALRALCEKLMPDDMADFDKAVSRSLGVTGVWSIAIQEAVGKEKARKA